MKNVAPQPKHFCTKSQPSVSAAENKEIGKGFHIYWYKFPPEKFLHSIPQYCKHLYIETHGFVKHSGSEDRNSKQMNSVSKFRPFQSYSCEWSVSVLFTPSGAVRLSQIPHHDPSKLTPSSTEKWKRPTWGYLHHCSRQTFSKVQHERAGEVCRVLKSFQWRVGRRRSGVEESRGQESRPASVGARTQPLDSAYSSGKEGVDSWWWTGGVRGWQRSGFDSSGSHVGQELVWYFGKHFFSKTSHTEDVVSSSINVVSERNELRRGNKENKGEETRRGEERRQEHGRKQKPRTWLYIR